MEGFEQSRLPIVSAVPEVALDYLLEAEFANCACAHDLSQQSGSLHRVIRTGRSIMRNVIDSYNNYDQYHPMVSTIVGIVFFFKNSPREPTWLACYRSASMVDVRMIFAFSREFLDCQERITRHVSSWEFSRQHRRVSNASPEAGSKSSGHSI